MKSKKKSKKPHASPYCGTKFSRNSRSEPVKTWKEGEPMKGSMGDTVIIRDGKIFVGLKEKKDAGS